MDQVKLEYFHRYIDIITQIKAWELVENRYGRFGKTQKKIEELRHELYDLANSYNSCPKGEYRQAFDELFYIDFCDWLYNVLTQPEQKKIVQKYNTESKELAKKIVMKLKEDDIL